MANQNDSFLQFTSLTAAQNRALQLASAMHVDGVFTQFWHEQIACTDGSAVLVIHSSGPYSSKPGATALQQLTPSEIAALVPYATVQAILPYPLPSS